MQKNFGFLEMRLQKFHSEKIFAANIMRAKDIDGQIIVYSVFVDPMLSYLFSKDEILKRENKKIFGLLPSDYEHDSAAK